MQDVCLPLEQGLLCLDNRKAVFEATLCGVRDNRGFRKKYATAWADYEWFCCAISPHGGVLCHPGLWLAKQGTICALVMSSQNQLTQVWYYLTLCGDGGRLCYIRVGMGKGMGNAPKQRTSIMGLLAGYMRVWLMLILSIGALSNPTGLSTLSLLFIVQ
ncbi:hypothetical protein F5Y08DRAFT_119754 [Xylaria arbuscula]|nr:hypothetical protein F5Y08DRAFT_119754 [Xylaria arbuscula]